MNDIGDIHNADAALPVTILTGFLGSGKTTLLARLLRDPRFAHTAVIINEFGEVGLDHDLLEQSRDELVLLANGCVCCTVRQDLLTTLERIHSQRGTLAVDRVIVETTGLADPAPILHTLMADPALAARFRLERLVTTVDAVNGAGTLREHAVAVKQAAVADRLVLTKLDIASPAQADSLRASLRGINHMAPLYPADHGGIDPEWLFGEDDRACQACGMAHDDGHAHGHDSGQEYCQEHGHEHGHEHGRERGRHHGHDHHGHDGDHGDGHAGGHAHLHDSGIRSFSMVLDAPVPWEKFVRWLDLVAAMRGDDLLRVKGLVQVAEHPDQPMVVHGVQHVFHPPLKLERWPGADRRTRLVFITRNIEQEDIALTLQIFASKN